ncbi:MAG: polymer-forming cytoskeletal protein [candidate division KSB1 bacterium]|nr:polymer-forming cytoskeletal protein [candidate division KSB1 bacterium]MDZ7335658.1 polymer-forming cytoskeletal protein [candidate division KSB1 bacterium]MDZ7357723.1 polymer-forming cytoskeletal protein [candidate division KSB1 bacterium]MDZ7377443.1 polymer-forming cytoskeletal protein [candidate division KSB1 bacterium]MDZ7402035.1 polymer-forming cytoskeletal protein [candidate division KSB1 bacterium]
MSKKEEDGISRSGDLNTIVGKGSSLEGTLKVENSVRVDGRIKGNLTTTELLVIGKDGEIEGDIIAKNAIIGGRVRGKVSATGKVVLESKAVFLGELKTSRLVIDDGAIFDGRCSMQRDGKLPFEPKIGESPVAPDLKKGPQRPE